MMDMAQNEKKTTNLLDKLSEIGEELETDRLRYEAENDTWWDSLTEEEREDAFYAVVKRIHKAEMVDKGTYRWALYDVFRFDAGMYMRGMDCGYMALHNVIGNGEDYQAMMGVNRIEMIDDGREFVKYLKDDERVRYVLQDDNRTLKIFVDKVTRIKLK